MVSWSESESTEGSTAQYISTSDSPVKIRATIDDPLFEGAADDLMVMCEHGNPGRKYVAFEGISTGRRFIACVTEGANNCGLVYQHNNRMACLEHSSTVHNLTQ
ncbi:unnamed protein product [Triticum aestivum]|uniref:Uncharacterized protein n=1 Tax=Triticum aestivum TaxID=4565 RepID=A0A7H4LEN8_WHEAT|nr:unnamed protein product [Triticum aestivum]